MQVFWELYSHIDEKNSGRKFEDMFLVKIANKGTSLSKNHVSNQQFASRLLLWTDIKIKMNP